MGRENLSNYSGFVDFRVLLTDFRSFLKGLYTFANSPPAKRIENRLNLSGGTGSKEKHMAPRPRSTMALFGEAEKGQFRKAYVLRELPQLVDTFGNPPEESQGISFAIQALLYRRELIYFRVEEEGFSTDDYLFGLRHLESVKKLHALCMPGVGEPEIMEVSKEVCDKHNSVLITSQKDLYDYLTWR